MTRIKASAAAALALALMGCATGAQTIAYSMAVELIEAHIEAGVELGDLRGDGRRTNAIAACAAVTARMVLVERIEAEGREPTTAPPGLEVRAWCVRGGVDAAAGAAA